MRHLLVLLTRVSTCCHRFSQNYASLIKLLAREDFYSPYLISISPGSFNWEKEKIQYPFAIKLFNWWSPVSWYIVKGGGKNYISRKLLQAVWRFFWPAEYKSSELVIFIEAKALLVIYSESSHYENLLFQEIQEGHITYSLNCKCLYLGGSWRK